MKLLYDTVSAGEAVQSSRSPTALSSLFSATRFQPLTTFSCAVSAGAAFHVARTPAW